MDKNSTLGQIFEKGQNTATTTFSDVANTVKNQVIGQESSPDQTVSNSNQQANQGLTINENVNTPDRTKEVVQDFYAPSENPDKPVATAQKDSEELARVRQDLQKEKQRHLEQHRETYYDPLFAYEHKKPQEEEERPAEKAERQKMEDLKEDSEKKKKEDVDISVQRAQTKPEAHPGVAG